MDRDWFKLQNSNQVLATALRLPSPFYSGAPADVVARTACSCLFIEGIQSPLQLLNYMQAHLWGTKC